MVRPSLWFATSKTDWGGADDWLLLALHEDNAMKSIFSSKTFWFNLLSGLATLFALPQISALAGPENLKYLAAAVAAVNILLRYITTGPVSFEA